MSRGALGRWRTTMLLALAGLADSLYLTWYHYDPSVRACVASGGCETVNASRFAMLGSVPVAVIGVAGYLLVLAALGVRRWGPFRLQRAARYGVYALAAAGTGFSLYLTAVEAFVLRAFCTWCLVSAVLVTAVCAVATVDLTAADRV